MKRCRRRRALGRRYGHLFGSPPRAPRRAGEQAYVGRHRILLASDGAYMIYGPGGQFQTTRETWPAAVTYAGGSP